MSILYKHNLEIINDFGEKTTVGTTSFIIKDNNYNDVVCGIKYSISTYGPLSVHSIAVGELSIHKSFPLKGNWFSNLFKFPKVQSISLKRADLKHLPELQKVFEEAIESFSLWYYEGKEDEKLKREKQDQLKRVEEAKVLLGEKHCC